MKKLFFVLISFALLSACKQNCCEQKNDCDMKVVSDEIVKKTIDTLLVTCGESQKVRIEKGVTQVALFWNKEDGSIEDFEMFCKDNFVTDETALQAFFEKTSGYFEILYGNFNKIDIELKKVLHLDKGEITPVDMIFGSYNASSHLTDDLFNNKLAHHVLLNFPFYNLEEKETMGENWSRLQWAYCRMGSAFTSRTPAALLLKESEISTQADSYIAEYNIVMSNLRNNEDEKLFPDGMKLISHWGLRDELKSNYNNKEIGLQKQRMIYEVMKRIVAQEIPQNVINNDSVLWKPFENKVMVGNQYKTSEREPDTRYEHLLANFKILKEIDAYNPYYPTYIQRAFDKNMEMRQEFIEQLFVELVSSEQVAKVGALISQRLGRPLEPFDIWYDGFKARSSINEDELSAELRKKFPNVNAFEKGIPEVLVNLGSSKEKAMEIAALIKVEGARGAGHAWGAQMKNDFSYLRTRIPAGGMDYKGYNIAMHELGHNYEQTITLNDVDYWVMRGVPNTAFTEAMAFMFQKRDLVMMGKKNTDENASNYQTLDIFWSLYEIMGVSLVDMEVWKWLYKNPEATPEQLKDQVVAISKDIWNKYYAPVFKTKDELILGIYSHMIAYPLYLSAYPVGHLIEFQVDGYINEKKANFANETFRMYTAGALVPKQWMLNAVGEELSNKPMLKAVDNSLLNMK